MKKLALFLALVLTLCACAPSAPVEVDTTTKFTSEGFTLSVPNEYVDLLLIDATVSDAGNRSTFFSVREKASVDAAKEMWPDDPTVGGGFLFGIGRANEAQFREMMMYGMTGADVIARDKAGNYYIYYHPTDVQLLRVGDTTDADWEQYTRMCEWSEQMKHTFVDDNPGLTAYTRTCTDIDCVLHQIAYGDGQPQLIAKDGDVVYTPERSQSLPYLEQLLDDVLFYALQDEGFEPEGSYINLRTPNTMPFNSFDFFTDEGQQQFVRLNMNDVGPFCFVATKEGEEVPVGKIVAEWLDALTR